MALAVVVLQRALLVEEGGPTLRPDWAPRHPRGRRPPLLDGPPLLQPHSGRLLPMPLHVQTPLLLHWGEAGVGGGAPHPMVACQGPLRTMTLMHRYAFFLVCVYMRERESVGHVHECIHGCVYWQFQAVSIYVCLHDCVTTCTQIVAVQEDEDDGGRGDRQLTTYDDL